jgi:hypothetical protein
MEIQESYLSKNDGVGIGRISGGIKICRVAAYLNHSLQPTAYGGG